MALPNFSDFREDDPVAFYLGDAHGDLAALADGAVLVDGRYLPVHSYVLAPQSELLRELFEARRGGSAVVHGGGSANGHVHVNGSHSHNHHSHLEVRTLTDTCRQLSSLLGTYETLAAAATSPALHRTHRRGAPLTALPTHHPRSCHPAQVILSDHHGLEGFSLKRMAHFLRLAYWPDEVATLSLDAPGVGKSLSACALLAHQLEVPGLLDKLVARMERAGGWVAVLNCRYVLMAVWVAGRAELPICANCAVCGGGCRLHLFISG